jgi:hypothetical protein
VASRLLITGQLSAPPAPPCGPRRGCPPKKGPVLGAPKTLARKRRGGQPPPRDAGALGQAGAGLGHAVRPARLLRVVVVRRPLPRARPPGQPKPSPPIAAVFTTARTLWLEAILTQSREPWAVEISSRDSTAFAGLGQDQCRKRKRVVGATTFRLVLTAARTLWLVEHTARGPAIARGGYRPWSRQKLAPTQLDLVWPWREALHAAGVFPIPRVAPGRVQNPDRPAQPLPLAA